MKTMLVKDFMTLQAITFSKEMPLSAALHKVINSDLFGGPVIDEQKKVIGFLSEQDLLDNLVKASYFCQDSHTVEDCMHREVLSVAPDLPIIELAQMIRAGKPKMYPVIDNGRLVGVISRHQVLKAVSLSLDDCFRHPV